MYTLKYNFKDKDCKNFDDLLNEVKEIPDNECFSIIDKRESMQRVIYLDKKEDGLFESYGQQKLFDIDGLNKAESKKKSK